MKHELKIWPRYFEKVLDGSKTFEIRKNDRNFQVGDILILKEFIPGYRDLTGPDLVVVESEYTGRVIEKEISYILYGGGYGMGLREGYCILALKDKTIGVDKSE